MDIEHIRALVELMVDNDMSRIEIREGDTHILLRRGQPVIASGAPIAAPATVQIAPSVAATSSPASEAAPPASSSPAGPGEVLIRSPMVGTFYSAPDPESPAFVKIGDSVSAQTVICLIEAMKVFNEIKAEVTGRITKVLVQNAQAVEFDQPLFAVVPA